MVRGWSSQCPRCGSTGPLDDGVTGCGFCGDGGVGMPMVPSARALDRPRPARSASGGAGRDVAMVGAPPSGGQAGQPG